jgi:SAM-dependent methyltransferase
MPDTILQPLASMLEEGIQVSFIPYYSGPFQHFDRSVNQTLSWDIKPSLAIIPEGSKRVIEIGSGSGRLTLPIAQRVSRLVALEREPDAIRCLTDEIATRGRGLPIEPVCADAAEFEVSERYDAVLLLGLSLHVMSLATISLIAKMAYNAVGPGGSFCYNVFDDRAAVDFEEAMPPTAPSIRLKCYSDENGVERLMTRFARFDPKSREIYENWLVDLRYAPGMHQPAFYAATMTSYLWSPDMISKIIKNEGFNIVEITKEKMSIVGREGADVQFVRALRSS